MLWKPTQPNKMELKIWCMLCFTMGKVIGTCMLLLSFLCWLGLAFNSFWPFCLFIEVKRAGQGKCQLLEGGWSILCCTLTDWPEEIKTKQKWTVVLCNKNEFFHKESNWFEWKARVRFSVLAMANPCKLCRTLFFWRHNTGSGKLMVVGQAG